MTPRRWLAQEEASLAWRGRRPAASSKVLLVQWAGEACWPLDLKQVDYRVRYCARGMDAARSADTRLDGKPLLDRYLLQFWPGSVGPDRVVRQTSDVAAYWHRAARELPPPPTAEQKAEAERRARLDPDRARQRQYDYTEALRWGGRPPT